MPSSKKKKGQVYDETELALIGIDYVNKKKVVKELETQIKTLRTPLESFVVEHGKELESGSKLSVIPYTDVDVHLKQTFRAGKVLRAEAIEVLTENHLEECIENVPIVREDVIERLYEAGKISDEVISKLFAEKSTYAFSVEIKEKFKDAPEEES